MSNDQDRTCDAVGHRLDRAVVPLVPERDVLPDLQSAASRKWQGDPACQQAGLFARAAAEIERLRKELGECSVGWESGTRALAENLVLRTALDKIAERTSSDDPCRALVQIARDALRPNVGDERTTTARPNDGK